MNEEDKIAELKQWVADLQSGMWINCVYCGKRYGPAKGVIASEVLHEHIAACPEHPLSKAMARILELEAALKRDPEFEILRSDEVRLLRDEVRIARADLERMTRDRDSWRRDALALGWTPGGELPPAPTGAA